MARRGLDLRDLGELAWVLSGGGSSMAAIHYVPRLEIGLLVVPLPIYRFDILGGSFCLGFFSGGDLRRRGGRAFQHGRTAWLDDDERRNRPREISGPMVRETRSPLRPPDICDRILPGRDDVDVDNADYRVFAA